MKHEDDMTPGEYRRWKKDPRNDPNGHSHYCEQCDNYWECPQLWHCRRDEKTLCPEHMEAT